MDLEPNGEEETLLNVTFRDCVATGNAGNAWDISVNTNHSIVFERCAAENCAGGYYMPLMPSGFCSGFNIQDELGARRQRAHKYWPNQSITGTGSVELIEDGQGMFTMSMRAS